MNRSKKKKRMVKIETFATRVYHELSKVPKGKVITYKALARIAGNPNAARVVGLLMKNNKYPNLIPCYKVVRSDGSIGKYSAKGGKEKKIQLLKKEGIKIIKGKIIDDRYIIK